MPARSSLIRAAQVLTAKGPAGLADRLSRRLLPMPPAPDAARLLAFARTQAQARHAALFQSWHVAQHHARRAGPVEAQIAGAAASPQMRRALDRTDPDWFGPDGHSVGASRTDGRSPDSASAPPHIAPPHTPAQPEMCSPHWTSADWDSADPVTLRAMDGRRLWPGPLEPTDAPPQVSVVTRTLGDRPWLLAQAIASVLNQAGVGVEHVIVQDGGGDSMAPLCARVRQVYGADCRHLAAGRVGRSAAANAGVAAARAPLVLLLDDDDLLLPHHAALLAAALAGAPGAPAAHALAWEVPSTLPPDAPPVEAAYIRHPHQALGFSRRRLARVNHLPIQSVLFRASAYARCGGMDASFDLLEDWDLWRRMAALGDFVRVPRLTSLYRVPADPAAAAARRAALGGAPAR